jgi:hypothetical protein
MPDELDLDDTTTDDASDDSIEDAELDDKDIGDGDVDPLDVPLDEVEELSDEDGIIDPEKEGEDPFGFGSFGELNEDGEFIAPAVDEDEEDEEAVDEDLF